MKGFIVPGMASRYQRLVPILESAVERGWPGGQVSFFRFGTIIEDLPERRYLEAQHPRFYMNQKVLKETLIQNVIDKASADSLTIIVTDLFQTDVDVNLITGKIKEKYIAKGLAVGVFGIKSEFNGRIFDVGPNNYSFNYHSDNSQPPTFRPFYVLALGSHSDVSNYFDELLKSEIGTFDEIQDVVLSPYLSERVASFEGSAITDVNKLQEVSNLLPTIAKTDQVRQFRIIDSDTPLASFNARLSYERLGHTMPITSTELLADVTAFTCGAIGNNSSKTASPQPLTENGDSKRALTIEDAHLNEASLDFKAEIVPAFLTAGNIYCFKVTLRPKEFGGPSWFTEWNMSGEQVEGSNKNPNKFNGSTTFNLQAFLTNLWATTLQLDKPRVAEFYFYVKTG